MQELSGARRMGDRDTPAKTECPWLRFHEKIVGGGVNALKGRWRDPSEKLGTHGSVFMDKLLDVVLTH